VNEDQDECECPENGYWDTDNCTICNELSTVNTDENGCDCNEGVYGSDEGLCDIDCSGEN